MDCSMPGYSVLHHFPEFAQTRGNVLMVEALEWRERRQSGHRSTSSVAANPWESRITARHACWPFLIFYFKFSQSALFRVLVAQSCPTLCNPVDCSSPAPLSMEFSRQEYWSGLPFLLVTHVYYLFWVETCLAILPTINIIMLLFSH